MGKVEICVYPKCSSILSQFFTKLLQGCNEVKVTENADTVFLIIDEYTVDLFEKNYFSFIGKRVIAYVAQLNYKTIPLIKLADIVFYQDKNQKELAELVMEFSIQYKILQLPCSEINYIDSYNTDIVVYTDYPLEETNISDYNRSLENKYTTVHWVTITNDSEGTVLKPICCMKNTEELLGNPPKGVKYVIFNDKAKLDDITDKISHADKTAIYYNLNGNLGGFILNSLGFIPYLTRPCEHKYSSFDEFKLEILDAIFEIATITKYIVTPDHYLELNVISGKVLNNRFVFSVCFRNQPKKIIRCIESICKQNKNLNFGVVVIDDMSDDNIIEQVKFILNDYGVDHVIVRNNDRKYASRNFYNVIHCLVNNDDSYIIEVDGDDYLYDSYVLDTVNEAVENESLKTIGDFCVDNGKEIKFKVYEKEKSAVDFSCPRNLSKCASWYHLRVTKRSILKQIEIEHFLEIDGRQWLKFNHDISVHSRAVELSKGKIVVIDKELYVYDISGNHHDTIELMNEFDQENWSYGTFLLDNSYLFRMYLPLFEEPQKTPSSTLGKGLDDNLYFE